MSASNGRPFTFARRGGAVGFAAVLMLAGASLTGCSIARAVRTVTHNVQSNKATITSFTQGLKSGDATPFQVTYVTTGSSPTTVIYAVRPPNDVTFKELASGGAGGSASGSSPTADLISNSTGEYSCSKSTSGGTAAWTCEKLGKANATAQNQILNIYTPSHWVNFLTGLSIAAGFAGDKVTKSTLTVNGFQMNCVDFRAQGIKGTSKICSTSAGILGYVKVAGTSTSFEITHYTTSPAASAFELPPGAKITTPQSSGG